MVQITKQGGEKMFINPSTVEILKEYEILGKQVAKIFFTSGNSVVALATVGEMLDILNNGNKIG